MWFFASVGLGDHVRASVVTAVELKTALLENLMGDQAEWNYHKTSEQVPSLLVDLMSSHALRSHQHHVC